MDPRFWEQGFESIGSACKVSGCRVSRLLLKDFKGRRFRFKEPGLKA